MKDIDFGTTKETNVLDNEGSTVTDIINIRAGEVTLPVRKSYEIKIRVHTQKQEHTEYLKFSDDLNKDVTMLEPSFKIEHPKLGRDNGYYLVVKCFTRLEY